MPWLGKPGDGGVQKGQSGNCRLGSKPWVFSATWTTASGCYASTPCFSWGGLLVQLLTALSLGILAGPLGGGFLLMLISYFREGRRPVLNDLFSGLQLFPFFFLVLLILFG